jgi:hypothetical protein
VREKHCEKIQDSAIRQTKIRQRTSKERDREIKGQTILSLQRQTTFQCPH